MTGVQTCALPIFGDPSPVGGIDLTDQFLDVEIKDQGPAIKIPFPLHHLDWSQIQGVNPILLRSYPVSLPQFLGIKETPTEPIQKISAAQPLR